MQMRSKFLRHLAVFAVNVSQELNITAQLLRIWDGQNLYHLHIRKKFEPDFIPVSVPGVGGNMPLRTVNFGLQPKSTNCSSHLEVAIRPCDCLAIS